MSNCVTRRCNCDVGDNQWRTDAGILTNKGALPLKEFVFDVGSRVNASALLTLGSIYCVNKKHGMCMFELGEASKLTYSHARTRARTHARTHAHTHARTHAHAPAHAHTRTGVHAHLLIYTYIGAFVCVCVCALSPYDYTDVNHGQ